MTTHLDPDPTPPHGTPRPVSAPLPMPSYSFHDEEVLHALDALEDALVNAREWITQTVIAIRSESYSPDEALDDLAQLQYPDSSVFHLVTVALGALASFTDTNSHPFGGALDR